MKQNQLGMGLLEMGDDFKEDPVFYCIFTHN